MKNKRLCHRGHRDKREFRSQKAEVEKLKLATEGTENLEKKGEVKKK